MSSWPKIIKLTDTEGDEWSLWNTFIEIAFEDLESLTPVQQTAAIALLYDNEGNNNGHLGVFCYRTEFQPIQLIESLLEIGAKQNLEFVKKIVAVLGYDLPSGHQDRDLFVMNKWTDELDLYEGMADYDEVSLCLKSYLKEHRPEFIIIED